MLMTDSWLLSITAASKQAANTTAQILLAQFQEKEVPKFFVPNLNAAQVKTSYLLETLQNTFVNLSYKQPTFKKVKLVFVFQLFLEFLYF